MQSDRQLVSSISLPFPVVPAPDYSGGEDTRWCPASAATRKSLRSFSQSVRGLGSGRGPRPGEKAFRLFTATVFTGRRSCARLFGWSGVELWRQLSAARYSLLSSSALKLPARAVVVLLFVLGGHHSELAAGCFCCFGLFLGCRSSCAVVP